MPKPLELTPCLIGLQRVTLAAATAIGEYVSTVQARRREEHPDDVVARCTWTDEESVELGRLYEEHTVTGLAVRAHPSAGAGPRRGPPRPDLGRPQDGRAGACCGLTVRTRSRIWHATVSTGGDGMPEVACNACGGQRGTEKTEHTVELDAKGNEAHKQRTSWSPCGRCGGSGVIYQ